jgi:hypothetical protein
MLRELLYAGGSRALCGLLYAGGSRTLCGLLYAGGSRTLCGHPYTGYIKTAAVYFIRPPFYLSRFPLFNYPVSLTRY